MSEEVDGCRDHLHLGGDIPHRGVEEAARLADVGGQHAPATREVLDELPGLLRVSEVVGIGRRPVDEHHRVVHQVRADVRAVDNGVDAVLAQMLGRSDAGQHEQLRGVVGPGAQDHLTGGAHCGHLPTDLRDHSDGSTALDHNPVHQGVGRDREVRLPTTRREVTVPGGPSLAAAGEALEHAGAHLLGAVEVLVERHARLGHGLHESARHRTGVGGVLDVLGPLVSVELARASAVVLHASEERKDLVIGPSGGPGFGPPVVVRAVASDVHHGVDAAGAAEHLAARLVDAPPVEVGLRLGLVVPVELGVELLREGSGDLDVEVGSAPPARLQDEDLRVRVLAQSRGEDRPAGPAAHDDVVVVLHAVLLRCSTPSSSGHRGSEAL